MNKDQLKAAFAKGARIQAWHLLQGATNSNHGQWDTLTPAEGAEPEFGCEAHLYRVHPEDLSLIAELGQEVVAVAQHQFRTMYGPGPDDSLPWANCDADFMSRFSHRDNLEFRKLYTSPAHTSEARDGERLDWIERAVTEKAAVWLLPSADHRFVQVRWSRGDVENSPIAPNLREAIDAAMRQEAGHD